MTPVSQKHGVDEIFRIGLFVFACVLFVSGIVLGFKGQTGSASIMFAAGVFCLIFAFLARFKKFKGLGIEAELWEQKQEEASQLIETLQLLSVIVSEQLLNLNSKMGRWDSAPTRKELFELADRLDKVLTNVNVLPDKRERMKGVYYYITTFDMARPIVKKINDVVENKAKEQRELRNRFGSPIKDSEGYLKATERLKDIEGQKVDMDDVVRLASNIETYNELEDSVSAADCLTEGERVELRTTIAEEMADLYEWVTERRLRRPEIWFSGGPQ